MHLVHPCQLKASDQRALKLEMRERFFQHILEGQRRTRSKDEARSNTHDNLLGFGLGEKLTGNRRTGEMAVVFFVQQKVPRANLQTRLTLPKDVNGITTDVVEIGGPFRALGNGAALDPTVQQPRPVPAGVAIGNAKTTGSLGYPVTRPDITSEMILSNYHVLADLTSPASTPDIYQPGNASGAPAADAKIGTFRAGVPIDFTPGAVNYMDAAVATVSAGMCRASMRDIGPITGAQDPSGGETVTIYGEATGYAVGTIRYQLTSLSISYEPGDAWFEDQLVVCRDPNSPFIATTGDSGSLVIKSPFVACGLLIAAFGTDYAIATPIERILRRFRMALVVP